MVPVALCGASALGRSMYVVVTRHSHHRYCSTIGVIVSLAPRCGASATVSIGQVYVRRGCIGHDWIPPSVSRECGNHVSSIPLWSFGHGFIRQVCVHRGCMGDICRWLNTINVNAFSLRNDVRNIRYPDVPPSLVHDHFQLGLHVDQAYLAVSVTVRLF